MSRELLKTNVELPDRELVLLADKIVKEIEAGKQALAISINETIKTTYWKIGRHIVEFEQQVWQACYSCEDPEEASAFSLPSRLLQAP